MSTRDEFDWHDDVVVVRTQPAIAVYANPHDEVVVRQEGQLGYDEDHWIFIAQDNVLKVVRAILAVAGIEVAMARMDDGGLDEPLVLPKAKDKTAAERQRRRRVKNRDIDLNTVTAGVTDRDSPLFDLIAAE